DAEIREAGRRALIAKYPMSRVSRAYEKGETQDFIKLCVDAETNEILGAAMLGTGGDEVIHVLLDVMYAKAPYTVIQRAMHIHPTLAEYLRRVLGCAFLAPDILEAILYGRHPADLTVKKLS